MNSADGACGYSQLQQTLRAAAGVRNAYANVKIGSGTQRGADLANPADRVKVWRGSINEVVLQPGGEAIMA